MNIFLVGCRTRGRVESQAGAAALRALAAELAPLDPEAIETWESPGGNVVVTAIGHPSEQLSFSYSYFERSRMALFAGRPILWEATGEANGRDALDPRYYLAPSEQWMHALDGRCTVVRYDDAAGVLDIYSDLLGAYPVYSAKGGDGTLWLTNKPALLVELLGLRGLSARALASFFTCSWAFGGETLWKDIVRLQRASLHRFKRSGEHEIVPLLPAETIASYFGSGADRRESARTLVETVRAGADWPGRSVRVPLTGGRDSRVVFAGALAAGIEFEATTLAFPHAAGFPDTVDVTLARRLAGEFGRTHSVTRPEPGLGVRDTARLLRLLSNGAVSIGTTGALTRPTASSRRVLSQSGQGGEIARAYYGIGEGSAAELAQSIYRHLVPPLPRPLVTPEAEELVRTYVVDWVREQLDLGIAPADVPDAFYLLEKMAHWAAPARACTNGRATPPRRSEVRGSCPTRWGFLPSSVSASSSTSGCSRSCRRLSCASPSTAHRLAGRASRAGGQPAPALPRVGFEDRPGAATAHAGAPCAQPRRWRGGSCRNAPARARHPLAPRVGRPRPQAHASPTVEGPGDVRPPQPPLPPRAGHDLRGRVIGRSSSIAADSPDHGQAVWETANAGMGRAR